MAVINVDDIYILDNTGQQVDDAVDYGLFNSNKNLLDNAYFVGGGSQLGDGIFPVNQRGQTSYTGGGTTFDRWRLSSGGSMTLAPEGVSVNGLMYQKKVLDLTVGDTYTLSRRNTDGTIVSVTGIVPSAEGWAVGNQNFGVYFRPSTKVCDIQILGEYFLQAIKLEKGSVSTLANDVPPDFGEELRKCQRYLWVHKFPANTIIGSGLTFNNNTIYDIVTPVAMRTGGTLTMTASTSLYVVYNATYALAGVVNGITSHGNHLRVSMNNNGGSDYGTLNHADLLVSYETVVTVANEP